jgi:trimeric autotransporter adhesin
MLVSMNGPVAVHLGDSLPSAATGKTGLHKSANKDDLSAAKSQEFLNLLLAAQEKGNATASASLKDLEPQGQDVKADGAKDSEAVEEEAEVATPTVSLPTVSLPTVSLPTVSLPTVSLPTLNAVIAQPVLTSHASADKIAKDGVESAGDADKSKTTRTEKASADPAPTLQPVQAKETTEAMLLPASLPNMFPTLTRDSTAAPDVKGAQDKSDSGGSTAAKVVLGASSLDKVGGEYGAEVASSAVAQGQQLELAAKHADGSDGTTEAIADVAGSNAVAVGADGRPTASATTKAASAVDVSAAKASSDGASGVSNSTASAAASDAVRDAAAASSASDATQKAASAAASVSATPAATSSGTPAASHDAAASVLPAGTHDVPAAPTGQGAQTATSDTGSPATKSDGLERTASTNSGLGSTDAHALLDGTTTGGRDGTWQISSNRVEAGFTNDQNSWTSVVAQRQQGHVTAMVELGSAAEHSSTASMLPQLNAHLAERQLPVEQLGVSVRQQFTSGQDASAANQGQQSNQSSQSQRGQQTSAPVVVSSVATTSAGIEGSPTGFDRNRISIRA